MFLFSLENKNFTSKVGDMLQLWIFSLKYDVLWHEFDVMHRLTFIPCGFKLLQLLNRPLINNK